MTLLSRRAADLRTLVESADPGARWAVGGAEGVHAGSDGADAAADVGGLLAVLALWPVIGSLVTEGALRLHTPLVAYGDPAALGAPAGATAHQLLTHPSGTAALTRLAEHLCGSPLTELAAARVWRPLGMAGTRSTGGTLHATVADLARFLRHVLAPEAPEAPEAREALADRAAPGDPADPADPAGPVPVTRAWTIESLRIRTGELTPARGLLWHPAPHGVWTHHAPTDPGPAVWVSPRHHRWALLLPTTAPGRPLRTAFREAAFG